MADPESPPERFTLRRWSQRKLAAARNQGDASKVTDRAKIAVGDSTSVPAGDRTSVAPGDRASAALPASAQSPVTPNRAATQDPAAAAPELPPVESLTFESDFTAFLRVGVDEVTRRGALKKLFSDPRFNVMDGLDTYIADYSLPDPIDPAIVRQMVSARYIFDPPKTRLNEDGVVEDVPGEPAAERTQAQANADSAIADAPAAPAQVAPQPAEGPTADAPPETRTLIATEGSNNVITRSPTEIAAAQPSIAPATPPESR